MTQQHYEKRLQQHKDIEASLIRRLKIQREDIAHYEKLLKIKFAIQH